MAETSLSRPSKSYTANEAIDLLFSLEDGAQLPATLLKEVDSDDGDMEELDYVTEDGSGSLVPPELLVHSFPEVFTDEPALRDSLLNLDDDLARLELLEQEADQDPTESMDTGE